MALQEQALFFHEIEVDQKKDKCLHVDMHLIAKYLSLWSSICLVYMQQPFPTKVGFEVVVRLLSPSPSFPAFCLMFVCWWWFVVVDDVVVAPCSL